MKFNKVFIVVNEGEVVFASKSIEAAEEFADEKNFAMGAGVLNEWGNDDPDEDDIAEAAYQAGYEGGYYEVEKVDLSNLSEDDTVEISDGSEIDVSDILKMLK